MSTVPSERAETENRSDPSRGQTTRADAGDNESATLQGGGSTPTERPSRDGVTADTEGDDGLPSSDMAALVGIGVIVGGLCLAFVLSVVR